MFGTPRLRRSLIASLLLILAVGYLFPFFWMVSTSLKPLEDLYLYPPPLLPQRVSLAAFGATLFQRGYGLLLRNSFAICGLTVGITLALSLLIVYPLTRMRVPEGFHRGILSWILSLRFLPPMVVVIPIFDIVRRIGLYDHPLALVLIYSAFSLPFSVWMMRGFLREVPMEIEEAALIDGASRWQAFFRILLPQLGPAISAVAIITFALSWSEFLFALVLTATPRSQTVSVGVWSLVTQFEIIWHEMAAMGVISALVPVALLLLVRRYVLRAFTFGAVG